jgi:hypothetical protein
MECNKSDENLNDNHYFACSWVTTLDDLGTSNAQCVSTVVNILYKRVKSKCKRISMHLKMTVAGCDAMQSGRAVVTMMIQQFFLQYWYMPSRLHGFTTQMTVIIIYHNMNLKSHFTWKYPNQPHQNKYSLSPFSMCGKTSVTSTICN